MSDDTSDHDDEHRHDDDGVPDARAAAASAYVDGEASDDEVRLVESDAALRAEVRRLRAIGDELRRVPPLAPAQRDRLLGAALDELAAGGAAHGPAATRHAGPAPSPAPLAPPLPARRGAGRWLAVAAAVVGVVATAGIAVALVAGSGGDDDSASNAVATADQATEEAESGAGADDGDAAPAGRSASAQDTPTETATATEPATGASDLSEDTGEVLAEREEEGSSAGTTGDTTSASRAAGDGQPIDAPADIESDTELVDWVLDVENRRILPPRAGERACGRTILGTARSGGGEIVVAVEGDRLLALDADTCDTVLETGVP